MQENKKGFRRDMADLVHDMRSPITAIYGSADVLLDGKVDSADYPKYLRLIKKEAERLNRMVGDMLSAEKLSEGRVHLNKTRFNLTEAVRLVLLGMEAAIEAKALQVELFAEECFVYGDEALITEVISCLLENAVKYTPNGQSLLLSVINEGDSVRFALKNTGVSISADDLPHIFDRFYRCADDEKGTGLGLYIAKGILDLHDSTLSAESEEGKYCLFSFCLPLRP